MADTVKERIRQFIKSKDISERAFCRKIGASTTYVNSIRVSVQPDKLKSISAAFPELNPVWLLTGEGDMLLSGNNNQVAGNGNTAVAGNGNKITHNDIAALLELQKGYQEMIHKKDEQIERLIGIIEDINKK